jgi:trans-aconitate 2-methyltransferase
MIIIADDMPTWNADQYLKFADERTRPCRDLVAAISITPVRRIIDLGCGPGNSTRVLEGKWPEAEITGLDSSASMIDVARREQPRHRWLVQGITEWTANARDDFDIVFANASLQWVDDHAWLYPKLLERVSPGGVLAVQIPANFDALPHRLMRELAPDGVSVKEWHAHEPPFYYEALAPHAAHVDIWQTEYLHVMANADAIVEWYKGSGLRPFLESIGSDAQRERFLDEYRDRIRAAYPQQRDGRVLFSFLRLFVIAVK